MKRRIWVFIILVAVYTLTTATNPGLKLRLSEKGLDYGAKVAIDLLTADVQGQTIPDQHGTARVVVGKVYYSLTGNRITSFTRPRSSLTTDANQGLTLTLTNAGISLHGNWRYKYKLGFIRIRDHGTVDVSVRRVNLRVSVAIGGDQAGRPTISSRSCQCQVGDVSVRFHGGASWLYNIFRRYAERPIEKNLRTKLCSSLQKLINVRARNNLQKMKVQVPVRDTVTLDYRLVAPPVFGSDYLESKHKSEFFWTSHRVEAPFQPKPIGSVPGAEKMVSICLSDYVGNSLGHAIYTYGREYLRHNLTVTDLPSDVRKFLNSNMLPESIRRFRQGTLELGMYATEPPKIQTQNNKIVGRLHGNIEIYIRLASGELISLLNVDTTIVTDVKVRMIGHTLLPRVDDFHIQMKTTDNTINSALGPILNVASKFFIVPKLNELGQEGFPLPVLDHLHYTHPELHLIKDAVCFKTNLLYDPNA